MMIFVVQVVLIVVVLLVVSDFMLGLEQHIPVGPASGHL